jgi:hypothetical protein
VLEKISSPVTVGVSQTQRESGISISFKTEASEKQKIEAAAILREMALQERAQEKMRIKAQMKEQEQIRIEAQERTDAADKESSEILRGKAAALEKTKEVVSKKAEKVAKEAVTKINKEKVTASESQEQSAAKNSTKTTENIATPQVVVAMDQVESAPKGRAYSEQSTNDVVVISASTTPDTKPEAPSAPTLTIDSQNNSYSPERPSSDGGPTAPAFEKTHPVEAVSDVPLLEIPSKIKEGVSGTRENSSNEESRSSQVRSEIVSMETESFFPREEAVGARATQELSVDHAMLVRYVKEISRSSNVVELRRTSYGSTATSSHPTSDTNASLVRTRTLSMNGITMSRAA